MSTERTTVKYVNLTDVAVGWTARVSSCVVGPKPDDEILPVIKVTKHRIVLQHPSGFRMPFYRHNGEGVDFTSARISLTYRSDGSEG